jgi:hypothetical protein
MLILWRRCVRAVMSSERRRNVEAGMQGVSRATREGLPGVLIFAVNQI